jgi:hypothetical protein
MGIAERTLNSERVKKLHMQGALLRQDYGGHGGKADVPAIALAAAGAPQRSRWGF